MKYLLTLLFLFSAHSFSGEIDGKYLTCISTKSGIHKHDEEWERYAGYKFNKGIVYRFGLSPRFDESFNYIENLKFMNFENTSGIKEMWYAKYYSTENTIEWTYKESLYPSVNIVNRKSLVHRNYIDYSDKSFYEYKCKVHNNFKSFQKQSNKYLKKYNPKYNKFVKKERKKAKKNKI